MASNPVGIMEEADKNDIGWKDSEIKLNAP